MPIHTRRVLALAAPVAAAAALLLTGCSSGSAGPAGSAGSAGAAATAPASVAASGAPVSGGKITIGGLATQALDPGQSTFSSQTRPWVLPVFSSLFSPPAKAGDDYGPGLASGYKYGAGNKTLAITLRPGLKFSDGTPLDAAAVVWNFNRYVQNHTREAQYFVYVTSVKATNPTTVTVTFSQPQSLLLDAMSDSSTGFMASPTAFQKMGANKFDAAPVGAGPYKITSADPGQQLVMAKNDLYWDAKHVYLDGITWQNTGLDAQTWLTNLKANSIQSVPMFGALTSPAVLSAVKSDPTLTMLAGASTNVSILPVNTTKAPFNKLQARQAINYCMDRAAIAKDVMQGFATPAYVLSGPDSQSLTGYQQGQTLDPVQYNVAKGTALVKALGGLSFTISTNSPSPVLTALQQEWQQCGIKAQINITEEYLSLVQNGNYQAAYTVNVNASLNPAGSTNYLDPNAINNKFGWKNDAIWSLVQQAKGTTVAAQSTALWHKIWGQLAQNGYVNPLISSPEYVASTSKLQGVVVESGVPDYTHAWLNS
jgi:peptide/nickel transport system substrate-binding protein